MDLRPAVACAFCTMRAVVLTVFITLLAVLQLPPASSAPGSITQILYGGCNVAASNGHDNFARNLNVVANSFIQNSSQLMYGMASSEEGSQSDHVYGMYQCTGDVSLPDCSSCVTKVLAALLRTNDSFCNILARGARAQLRGCFIRYEQYVFYNGFEKDGVYDLQDDWRCSNSSYSSSPLIYRQNVQTALENSAAAAPRHPLFGFNATSVGSGSNTAYVLTQCVGYINASQCAACLSQVSNNTAACNRSMTGMVFFNTCFYLFNDSSLVFTYNTSSPNAPFSRAPAMAIPSPDKSKNHTAAIVGIVVGVCALLAIVGAALALYLLKRRKKSDKSGADIYKAQGEQLIPKLGAKTFSLKELRDATDNFHPSNKLGEGGFGPVYQGRLKSGLEIAIKMLSAQSHQGRAQFFNEVNLITSVQHRNLIHLIGCCVEDSRPLLVYEYLPKRSLDLHLFDVNEKNALDWHTRFDILVGIARGLRHLHEDSPVRIIHRDIKASNILLDNNLNPKIADFGLARLFADDRSHLTTRVVGTLGYLAPEYAINGQLTEKADVYSFGLVALEMVSGRKVVDTKCDADQQNLLDWTWALYEKQQQLLILDERMQKAEKTLDTDVSKNVNVGEVTRVVHVALLCVQLQPQARPNMSEVYDMLCGESEILNVPTKPMTMGMLSPIADLLHDGTSGMFSKSNMPSWASQELTYSYDTTLISEVVPR